MNELTKQEAVDLVGIVLGSADPFRVESRDSLFARGLLDSKDKPLTFMSHIWLTDEGFTLANRELDIIRPENHPSVQAVVFDPEPDYDRYINERERQHEANLVATEAERDLKAYYAEHGDDAPDPTPQPKSVTTFEEEWPKWEGGYEGSFCRLCKGDGCTATRQRLEITDGKVYIHVQTQCFDCGQELHDARTEYALEEMVKDLIRLPLELTTANAALKTARRMHKGAESNVDYWQRQFKQVEAERDAARAAQDLLRGELVAITAERDELKAARELWTALRRKIWELVMQADSEWQLTNDLYELMK